MTAASDTATGDALVEALVDVWLDLPSLGEFLEIPNATAGGLTGFGWDRWHEDQRRFAIERTGHDVALKSRQVGFSTVELARDVQFARVHSGVRVQIVVADRKEAAQFFGRLKMMVDSLAKYGIVPSAAKYDTKSEIVWTDNRSAIYIVEAGDSLRPAQKAGRGGTIHRLHATEAAFWGRPEETWSSLRGATRLGTEIVIETTANGVDSWFHDVWNQTRAGRFGEFRAHFYSWLQRRDFVAEPSAYGGPQTRRERTWEQTLTELGASAEQIAWWRAAVQEHKLDKALREYPPTEEAAFQSRGGTWIEAEYLDAMARAIRDPLRTVKLRRGELRVFAEPQPGIAYVIGADVSEGLGRDSSTCCVEEHRTGRVVATYDDNQVKPVAFGHLLIEVSDLYNGALIGPEREGRRDRGTDDGSSREACGLVVINAIEDAGKGRRLYRDSETKRRGWATNRNTRGELLYTLLDQIEKAASPDASAGDVLLGTTPDRRTLAEARGMIEKRGKVRARGKASGTGDDGLFFAWAIANQIRARARLPGKSSRIATVGTLSSAGFRT